MVAAVVALLGGGVKPEMKRTGGNRRIQPSPKPVPLDKGGRVC
jgi:hypothetical protein